MQYGASLLHRISGGGGRGVVVVVVAVAAAATVPTYVTTVIRAHRTPMRCDGLVERGGKIKIKINIIHGDGEKKGNWFFYFLFRQGSSTRLAAYIVSSGSSVHVECNKNRARTHARTNKLAARKKHVRKKYK